MFQVMSYDKFLQSLNAWRLDRWLAVQEHNGVCGNGKLMYDGN